MNELRKIKNQISSIIEGSCNEYTVLEHEHVSDDVWSITVESKDTKKLYNFKDDGFEFYDFQEKSLTASK